jgi:hypothetical protein
MKRSLLPLLVAFSLHPRAEVVYENSSNFEGLFNNSQLESGDQVRLAGSARFLTGFALEYFASFAPTGDETARVRFYYNDGAGQEGLAEPGTLFYDSGAFSIVSGYRTVRGDQLDIFLEADVFTFTVEFAGLAASETAGLLYYNPPRVGSSEPSFWQKDGTEWQAVTVSGTSNNFAAQFIAEELLKILGIARATPGMAVTAVVRPGRSYGLEYKTALGSNAWTPYGGADLAAATNRVTFLDTAAGADSARFYRVVDRTAP